MLRLHEGNDTFLIVEDDKWLNIPHTHYRIPGVCFVKKPIWVKLLIRGHFCWVLPSGHLLSSHLLPKLGRRQPDHVGCLQPHLIIATTISMVTLGATISVTGLAIHL